MKFVFLDIDGVVVTKRSAYAGTGPCCPAAMTALSRVLSHPDFRLVISSARRLNNLAHFTEWFTRADSRAARLLGALAPVWSTPDRVVSSSSILPEQRRAEEIFEYCRSQNIPHSDCLVLDDLDLALFLPGVPFIHVDGDNGLSMEQLRQIETWAIQNA